MPQNTPLPRCNPLRNLRRRFEESLAVRLFVLTLAAILITEALIFIPSVAGLRQQWLGERIQAARIAALALEAAPMRAVSEELSESLLGSAEVLAVTEIEDGLRFQLLAPSTTIPGDAETRFIDLRNTNLLSQAGGILHEYAAPPGQMLVISAEGSQTGRVIEILVPQAPLKAAMIAFAQRAAIISLIIALVAALVIYLVLDSFVVGPVRRITVSVEQFSRDPGGWSRRLSPTLRQDEIGRAQNALAGMEEAVADAFRQRARLAALGSAVAKINHDLRNSLAAAQLVSEGLSLSEDPRVIRAIPRLRRALERAVDLATATLDYGKALPRAPVFQTLQILTIIQEAADEALVANPGTIRIDIPPTLLLRSDADHLHRIAANLIRNAAEAMTHADTHERSIRIYSEEGALLFEDSGPGIPQHTIENLFRPFSGSSRGGGTGLGLVIARELAESLGGRLELLRTGPRGTVFSLFLPGLGNSHD